MVIKIGNFKNSLPGKVVPKNPNEQAVELKRCFKKLESLNSIKEIPVSPKLVPPTGHSNSSSLSTKDFLESFQIKDSDIIKSLKPKEYNV